MRPYLLCYEHFLWLKMASILSLRTPRGKFALPRGFKTLFLIHFYLLFRPLDQRIRPQAATEFVTTGSQLEPDTECSNSDFLPLKAKNVFPESNSITIAHVPRIPRLGNRQPITHSESRAPVGQPQSVLSPQAYGLPDQRSRVGLSVFAGLPVWMNVGDPSTVGLHGIHNPLHDRLGSVSLGRG